jgi:hypothetical protein
MFKNFIDEFLKRGEVSDEWRETLISSKVAFKNFKTAVTHESIDPVNNYEQLEFFGDTILNNSIVWWVKTRHPQIVNVEWLTKIKHLFVSTRIVSKLARICGVDKVIEYDRNFFQVSSIENSNEFAEIVEDSFEALLGATCQSFVDVELEHGVGMQICQNIVWSLLDELNYPITYETIWDPPVIIKEMYDVVRWIFMWNEYNIPGVKDEKIIELRWWDRVSASMCSIRDPQKRAAYIHLFNSFHGGMNKTIKLDKTFVLTVEAFEYNMQIGKANRLPIPLFKQYFGEGEVLASARCISENEKSCKIDLALKGIEILKKNGYKYNNPPPMTSNPRKIKKLFRK